MVSNVFSGKAACSCGFREIQNAANAMQLENARKMATPPSRGKALECR